MKVHHIGYFVKNIEKSKEAFLKLGADVGETIYDPDRLVDIAWVKLDDSLIELVCPRKGSSAVGDAIKKQGSAPYHLCFECEDIESAIKDLTMSGYMEVCKPQKAIAINGCKVAFLYGLALGLIELVEI